MQSPAASLVARNRRNDADIVFQGFKLHGDLRGLMFAAEVEQRFQNRGKANLEVVYTFPLPWGAVLLGVEAELGGKKLSGVVVEKKEAEARYEETLSQGDAAIMLEKNHDGSYTASLGNLAAGEGCVVRFRYAELLRFEQRALRLTVPTVIAPRYGDPVRDGGLMPHQAAANDILAEYPLELEIGMHGDLARARVASPSHPVRMESRLGVLVVTLARAAALDRDFVLVLDNLAHDSIAVAGADMAGGAEGGRYAVLASFCPRLAATDGAGNPPAVQVKFLVDCSGSMEGDSIEAARAALSEAVGQLRPGDKFSLSRFGSGVEHHSRGLWTAGKPSLNSAREWCCQLQADMGGTEMERALKSTFRIGGKGDSASGRAAARDVLLVTDGEIYAIDGVVAAAKRSGHRVFAVGIGSSPAEGNLRRLAEATGGACDFVAPGEDAGPAILRMFARLRSPRVSDLAVAWPEGMAPEWVSPLDAALFDGDTLNVFALVRGLPAGEILLNGKDAAGEAVAVARASSPVEASDDTAVSRFAAAVRCGAGGDGEDVAKWAVAYQLVTERTNFLMVHERAEGEKAEKMPELHQVRPMMPAGWGGMGRIDIDCCKAVARPRLRFLRKARGMGRIDCCKAVAAAPAVLNRSLEDKNAVSPDEDVMRHNLREATNLALQSLSSREQEIVRMRYGLNDTGKEYTLQEVGEIFQVTRERIRQIEEKALLKLRSPYRKFDAVSPLEFCVWLEGNPDAGKRKMKSLMGVGTWNRLSSSVSTRAVVSRKACAQALKFLMSLPEVREALKNGEKPFQTRKAAILAAIDAAVADGRLDAPAKAAALVIVEDLAETTATYWRLAGHGVGKSIAPVAQPAV
jgi:Ca-activated chloride channel family protein